MKSLLMQSHILQTYEQSKEPTHPLYGITLHELKELITGYEEWVDND